VGKKSRFPRSALIRALLAAALAAPLSGTVLPLAAQSAKFTNPLPASPSNPVFSITSAFTLMAENRALALYLNEESLAIRLLNKKTGYVWSSDVDEFGEDYLNDRWKAFIQSGITIEYFMERRNAQGRTTVDRTATEESFLESGLSTARIIRLVDGFQVEAVFGGSGIGVSYETRITENGIETAMYPNGVAETETVRIVSVRFYPFMGAVRQGTQNGYFVLPDGDGSLVRFDRIYAAITKNYQKRYFGGDRGISPVIENGFEGFLREPDFPSYPVYGIVHGPGSGNALMTEIKSGAFFAELLMYPAGVRTNFYFISNRYLLRQPYTYIVSTGSQTTMITPRRAEFLIRERITLLDGENAGYVGIAKAYRDSLARDGLLKERPATPGDIPLYLNVLAGAANQGIFRNQPFVMTSIADMGTIVSDLVDAGARNIQLRPFNLFRHDLSGSERDRYTLWPNVGSLRDLLELKTRLEASSGRLIMGDAGPNAVYSRVGGVDLKEDVIRNINKRYDTETWRFGAVNFRSYRLNSGGVARMLTQDASELSGRGLTAEQITLSSPASSFNEKSLRWRDTAAVELAAALGGARERLEYISMVRGSLVPEYLPFVDALAGITMSAALYPYITDTIPFTSLVLRGSLDLFTENLNNTANLDESLLRMIERGIYPSYLITLDDPNKLLYSDISLWSSKYGDWRDEILSVYKKVNAAIGPVRGAAIINHKALASGVMKTSYENGVAVYVNYNSLPWEGDGVKVPAQGYEVRRP
jgi:hypothetical protein